MTTVIYVPHKYQSIAGKWVLEKPFSGLFLDMGLGKTIVTLTTIQTLLNCVEVLKPLVIAPKLVTEVTWTNEAEKWQHTAGLKISVIAGTPKKRIEAIYAKADIYTVSCDNIAWLVNYLGAAWAFDMCVIDESSRFKNSASKRFKAVRSVRKYFNRVILQTGTPIPNGLLDLWPQMYLLDQGKRLGKNKGAYVYEYFTPASQNGHIVYKYQIRPGAEEKIYSLVKDVCLSMKAEDWLEGQPEQQDIIVEVILDNFALYKEFKEKQVLVLPEAEISPDNAAGLYSKLLQYANGAVYDNTHKWHFVHDKKLDALEELVEGLQGKPLLIFYQFQSDLERMKKRFPDLKLMTKEHMNAWNRGEIPIAAMHPASAIGINLQDGGNYIAWFGVPANLEWYLQALTRILRQGQKFKVFNYVFLVKGSEEYKVFPSLQDKTFTQDKLFKALK
jgi:SNF2 family DNA or RNA helicase